MFKIKQFLLNTIVICVLAIGTSVISANAQSLQTGAIFLQPMGFSVAEQNKILDQMKANGVHLIRTDMRPEKAYIDFAKRAYADGIRIDALVGPQVPRGMMPWRLANADLELSRTYAQSLVQQLDANGVVLAGLELGNEINWRIAENAPINGVVLDASGLHNTPIGKQFIADFDQYLKLLVVLKDIRDHSSLNQKTPIISAGLVSLGLGDADIPWFQSHGYSVTLNATLDYLRAGGMDKLVDYYGIHYYPKDPTPEARKKHLDVSAVSECRPAGSTTGKPCWITEWGVDNIQKTCPINDTARAALVTETMNNFRDVARQGRLLSIYYYTWNSPAGSDDYQPSIYRCGQLTEAGRLAMSSK